jgi:Ser-tRNA(Ala) deacylase AlaX
VLQVTRRGAEAVHFVESALPVGKLVTQKLDWERRFDHMQQHSGNIQVLLCRRTFGSNQDRIPVGLKAVMTEVHYFPKSVKANAEIILAIHPNSSC